MNVYQINTENGNGTTTFETKPSAFYESILVSEHHALETLYHEVDPLCMYPIIDYQLVSNAYGRIGIDFK